MSIHRKQLEFTPYYYDCASAIVYMAKHHGIKFYCYEQIVEKGGWYTEGGWYTDEYIRYDFVPSPMPNRDCVYRVVDKKEENYQMTDGHSLAVRLNNAAQNRIYVHPDSLEKIISLLNSSEIFLPPKQQAQGGAE